MKLADRVVRRPKLGLTRTELGLAAGERMPRLREVCLEARRTCTLARAVLPLDAECGLRRSKLLSRRCEGCSLRHQ
eukprot:scaffold270595_cov23-Tisochrysis_lutea.AAC.2